MKKLTLTIAIVLGLGLISFANPNAGGLFQRGAMPESNGIYGNRSTGGTPMLPNHGESGNQDADGPLGSGIAVLAALGGAYLVAKKRKEN